MHQIYLITNLVNGKVYVGKTSKSLDKRLRKHKEAANSGRKTRLYASMRKHGSHNFVISQIAETEEEDEANRLECLWIFLMYAKETTHGYNMTDGGDGRIGIKDSPETRQLKKSVAAGRTFSLKAQERRIEVLHEKTGEKHHNFKKNVSTERIIELYQQGKSSRQIASILGVEKSLVMDRLQIAGEPVRPDSKEIRRQRLEEKGKSHLFKIDDEHIAILYKGGSTMEEIASLYEASHRTIGHHLSKMGVFSTRQQNKMKKAA